MVKPNIRRWVARKAVNIAILYWDWQYCQYFFHYCWSIAILFLNRYWRYFL